MSVSIRALVQYSGTKRRGFSLLEVLVALGILMGAVLVLHQAWTGNFFRVNKGRMYRDFHFLLQHRMAELEARYKGMAFDQVPEEGAGDFAELGDAFKNYAWSFAAQPFSFPNIVEQIDDETREQNPMVETVANKMTEFISSSILEFRLTVSLRRGKNVVSHSLSTYFVDYSQSVSLE